MKIGIIITGFNCEKYVERCIESCLNQTVKPHSIMVWNDASTDETENVLDKYVDNPLVEIHNAETNTGALYGRWIFTQNTDCDVVGFLGMDDQLTPDCVETLVDVYSNLDIQMTYGNWIDEQNGWVFDVKPYARDVWENRSFRTASWRATALNTFKTELLQMVPVDVLKDSNGVFFKNCTDLAYSFPCLEMVRPHECFVVSKPLYIYNRSHSNTTLNRLGRADKTRVREILKRIPKMEKQWTTR